MEPLHESWANSLFNHSFAMLFLYSFCLIWIFLNTWISKFDINKILLFFLPIAGCIFSNRKNNDYNLTTFLSLELWFLCLNVCFRLYEMADNTSFVKVFLVIFDMLKHIDCLYISFHPDMSFKSLDILWAFSSLPQLSVRFQIVYLFVYSDV